MDAHSEATVGLKVSLLVFGLVLVITLSYLVIKSNQQISEIYANAEIQQLNIN